MLPADPASVHLLVVHTHADPRSYLPALQAQGYRFTLLKKNPSKEDWECFDRVIRIDFQDSWEEVLSQAGKLHSQDPLSGTLSFSESGVLVASLLAAALGLGGNDPHAVLCTRNKYLMRKTLESAGLRMPPYRLVSSAKAIFEALRGHGQPMVLKPISGSSSYGVVRLNPDITLQEATEVWEEVSSYIRTYPAKYAEYPYEFWLPPRLEGLLEWEAMDPAEHLMLEGFVEGAQVSVDGFVVDQDVKIFAVVDVERQAHEKWFLEYQEWTPSRLPRPVQDQILQCVENTVRSLGLTRSMFHCELKVDSQGPVVLEIAGRQGADNISRFISHTCGINPYLIGAELAQGLKPQNQIRPRGAMKMRYFLPEQTGVLRGISGQKKVSEHPNVDELYFEFNTGEKIQSPPESYEFLGYISVKGDSAEQVDRVLDELYPQIQFQVEAEEPVEALSNSRTINP
ncbi:MAG: ATP-grasp domain-containing protein [Candidatus Omnitrophica bacterium]|nr:ATP-grasp domain-containing protein [Candidatus Omnitrophota bacterium]